MKFLLRKASSLLRPALLLLPMLLAAQPNPLVFAHVSVIDATGVPAKFNHTVVINGSRIARLGETGKVHVPKDASVVNATGKFLIPGLWDMHVHTASETFLSLYLVNGMEALQTATRNPAEYLGRLDSLGTIEEGKIADLVLREANPLDDINNTRRVAAVVLNGRLLPKSSLEEMLAGVETGDSGK